MFSVVYHPNYLSRLLDKLGLSLQQPLPRAVEQDDKEVRTAAGLTISGKTYKRHFDGGREQWLLPAATRQVQGHLWRTACAGSLRGQRTAISRNRCMSANPPPNNGTRAVS